MNHVICSPCICPVRCESPSRPEPGPQMCSFVSGDIRPIQVAWTSGSSWRTRWVPGSPATRATPRCDRIPGSKRLARDVGLQLSNTLDNASPCPARRQLLRSKAPRARNRCRRALTERRTVHLPLSRPPCGWSNRSCLLNPHRDPPPLPPQEILCRPCHVPADPSRPSSPDRSARYCPITSPPTSPKQIGNDTQCQF